MATLTETVFWISIAIIFYTYIGYPLLLLLFIFVKRITKQNRPYPNNHTNLPVTFIIPAYNEAELLSEKISNCLQIDYPSELLKIIIITDGSTDDPGRIIEKYAGIKHLDEPIRKGKLAAMNRAMAHAETDFVIFSDANTLVNKESVALMMRHYANDKIGAVSGEKRIIIYNNDTPVEKGEGLYWKYESFIKHLDSELYSVVGAAGELFSIRTALYTRLPEDIIIEDFVQSLLVCLNGKVVRYEPSALSTERASASVDDEMERKIRISAGGFQAIGYLARLFNIFRYPVLSFQYISHRVLRWTLCPLAFVFLFVSNLAIVYYNGPLFYTFFLFSQFLMLIMAIIGWLIARSSRDPGILNLPFYVLFMNYCVIAGFFRFAGRKQKSVWRKAGRA